ncbi:Wzz/FepE/Etk N-terminal domain-containing protein, partial [Aeromonas hydrophila]
MTQIKEHPPLPVAMSGGGEDEIDLRELFAALWRGKWWIVVSTLVGAAIAVLVAISLPNIYRSEALLA